MSIPAGTEDGIGLSRALRPLAPPGVSVMIPVFDDPDRLMRCLAALDNQTYPRDCFEIVVIDNGRNGKLRERISGLPRVRYTRESRPGSYASRNLGISAAGYDIFVFTDADCIPADEWLEEGARALLSKPDNGIVGGRIEGRFGDPERPNLFEFHQRFRAFDQKRNVEEIHFSATANLFTKRSVFEAVGPFRDDLMSVGDREWGQRVFKAGFRLIYSPDVLVQHPARSSMVEIVGQRVRITGGRFRRLPYNAFTWLRVIAKIRPLKEIKRYWNHAEMGSARNRLCFVAVEMLLFATTIAESIRLQLGGLPRRS